MDNKEYQAEYKRLLKIFEEYMNCALADKKNIPEPLGESMRYSLFAGGKRLRPVLMLKAADNFGCNLKKVLPFALAVEMVHTYSLIHDDLPAMDNDVLRRGKPTNHTVYGEAAAILAGDGLLSEAFEVIASDLENTSDLDLPDKVRAFKIIASGAGIRGMVGGQSVDVYCEKNACGDEKALNYIHNHKTASLIVAALTAGTVIANACAEAERAFENYGYDIGLAFQITDDILDVEGDPSKLGKSVGKDKKSGKLTFTGLYSVEEAKTESEKLVCHAQKIIEPYDRDGFFARFARNLLGRKS